jgi:hypothetical protein
MENSNYSLYWTTLVFSLLIGSISAYFLVREISASITIYRKGEYSKGVVIDLYQKNEGDGGAVGVAVIQYKIDEISYTVENRVKTNMSKTEYKIGEEISVVYLRENPSDGRVDSFTEKYISILILLGITSSFFVIFFLSIRFKNWILMQKGGTWPYG